MEELKYQTQPEFIFREIGNDTVLVPAGVTGELENSMIYLNDTYAFLWKQFQSPRTVSEVIQKAKEQYEDPDGVMEEQIRGAVKEFAHFSIIKSVPA